MLSNKNTIVHCLMFTDTFDLKNVLVNVEIN